jgi:uncharacterized RDD family membrane protein YckC
MLSERTNNLIISTPEGISFSLLLAGPATRFFAWAIDLACVSVIMSILGTLLFSLNIIGRDIAVAVSTLVYFAVSISYGILLEWNWRGQTLGKRLLKLRVVDEEGLQLQFNQVVIRNLLRFVDALPLFYFVGGLACAISPRSQRLGDIAASTVVIRTRPNPSYNVDALALAKYNSFRDFPHLTARLRQRVTPELTLLALQAVRRRENLEPAARIELFRDIAAQFQSMAPFPEEATLGLTDEQYVRNLVDCLFQTSRKDAAKEKAM